MEQEREFQDIDINGLVSQFKADEVHVVNERYLAVQSKLSQVMREAHDAVRVNEVKERLKEIEDGVEALDREFGSMSNRASEDDVYIKRLNKLLFGKRVRTIFEGQFKISPTRSSYLSIGSEGFARKQLQRSRMYDCIRDLGEFKFIASSMTDTRLRNHQGRPLKEEEMADVKKFFDIIAQWPTCEDVCEVLPVQVIDNAGKPFVSTKIEYRGGGEVKFIGDGRKTDGLDEYSIRNMTYPKEHTASSKQIYFTCAALLSLDAKQIVAGIREARVKYLEERKKCRDAMAQEFGKYMVAEAL